jgi:hypothetical protein
MLFARLIGGTAAPALGALRGADNGPLLFEADGVVITLDIQPGSSGYVSILGQLAADDQDQWTGAEVELEQLESTKLMTTLDDLGAFRWDHVRPGISQITIKSLNHVVVRISNIDFTV